VPLPIEDLSNIRETYLLLQSASGTNYYVVADSCVIVDREIFGTTLQFSLFNRLIKNGPRIGTAYVKSYRIFSNHQYVHIKMARGDGWYYPGSGSSPIDAVNELVFNDTTDSWNKAYSTRGTPEDYSVRLNTVPVWHAYGQPDKSLPSTDLPEFWQIDQSFDQQYGLMTNYLLHFTVNPSASISLVPFQVDLQKEVKRIDLTIHSNTEVLSGFWTLIPN
jgi:hypothetical protein